MLNSLFSPQFQQNPHPLLERLIQRDWMIYNLITLTFERNELMFKIQFVEEDTEYGLHEYYLLSVKKNDKEWKVEIVKDWQIFIQLELVYAFIFAHSDN